MTDKLTGKFITVIICHLLVHRCGPIQPAIMYRPNRSATPDLQYNENYRRRQKLDYSHDMNLPLLRGL